jgi:hypothetical protein
MLQFRVRAQHSAAATFVLDVISTLCGGTVFKNLFKVILFFLLISGYMQISMDQND